jgi:hypothetical protein
MYGATDLRHEDLARPGTSAPDRLRVSDAEEAEDDR